MTKLLDRCSGGYIRNSCYWGKSLSNMWDVFKGQQIKEFRTKWKRLMMLSGYLLDLVSKSLPCVSHTFQDDQLLVQLTDGRLYWCRG